MSDTRWEKQWEVFHDALDRPSDERTEYVRAACADDDELAAAVLELLDSHDDSATFLAEPLIVSTDALDALEPEALVGQSIGPFVIQEVIGEGGMGVVYAAEQTAPVQRRVALKVIKLGMNTREVVARFELERQALAVMNHPNVAKVYDAGATEDGRPYFVMEYVDGSPITEYCDSERFNNRERLELCREVFAGIKHAHQKGLIHRDIKPSNVLIERHDGGRPVAKIIDFGIAKATDQHATEQTMFTAVGRLIGTPAYMSPEQASPGGADVDTRSDIYSLSVLLYELLTGAVPFENQTLLSAGYAEMQRIIREDDPPPPSSRISRYDDETITALATKRHSNSRNLRRELAGDLDWIIMKGLEKDPTRRYDSVAGLAADIERHLANLPVVARPPATAYLLTKFVRRHAWGVGVAGAAVLAVVAFLTSTLIQSRELALALEATTIERGKAEQVTNFLVEVLTQSDPNVAQGETLTVREALDRGAETIGDQLSDQPETKQAILIQMAEIYRELGLYEQAETILQQARPLAESRSGQFVSIDGDLYQVLANLAHDQGEFEKAETYYSKTLEIRESLLDDHMDVALVLDNYGVLKTDMGEYERAEELLLAAMAMGRRLGDEDHNVKAGILQDLAYYYMLVGNNAAAGPLLEQAVVMQRRLYGDRSNQLATTLNFQATYLRRAGQPEEAVAALSEALEIYELTLGNKHPYFATTLSNVANALSAAGRLDEAQGMARRAVVLYEELFDTPTPNMATAYYTLANIQSRLGDYPEAEKGFRRVLELDISLLGNDHPNIISDIEQIATVVKNQGRLDEAEPLQQDVLQRRMSVLGADHPAVANALVNLASIQSLLKKYDSAEVHSLRAIELLATIEPDSARMMGAKSQLASVYREQERLLDAESLYLEILEQQRESVDADHPDIARTLHGLGVVRLDLGKAATTELEEALRIRAAALGDDHPDTTMTREALELAVQGNGSN